MEYRHTQSSSSVLLITGAVAVVVIVMMIAFGSSAGVLAVTFLVVVAVTALVVGFSRLTVLVDAQQIRASFAGVWPPKTIAFDDVVAARRVKNPWYYGYGVRKVPKGWMYNVQGPDAIELELSSGKVFRVGTDEVDRLASAVSAAMPDRPVT